MNEGDNRTKQVYIVQTSCTYLSSVFVTQAHLDNLETITTFPKQCNGINFSSQTNIFIEKLSSGLVVPVSGTAPAISKQSKIISLDISSMFTFITSACRHWDLFASCPRPPDKYSAHPQRRYSVLSVLMCRDNFATIITYLSHLRRGTLSQCRSLTGEALKKKKNHVISMVGRWGDPGLVQKCVLLHVTNLSHFL